MRILHLIDYGYIRGGAEINCMIMKRELNRRGHDARVFASNAGLKNGSTIETFADYRCFGTLGRWRIVNQAWNVRAIRSLKRAVEEFRPEVIHLHMFLTQLSPGVLRVIGHLPVVHTAHWFREVCMTGFKTLPGGQTCSYAMGASCLQQKCVPLRDWLPMAWQKRQFERYKHLVDRNVAISETVRHRLETGGVSVDDTIIECTTPQEMRPPLESPPRIGFAARMVREKGGFVLLAAFQSVLRDIPGAVLDVFGDGRCLGELKAYTDQKGLSGHVRFHGFLEQEPLHEALTRAWVQVAPTLVEEPLGMVAIEAAMRGTAVVASDIGGFRELVVDGETGYLATAGDVEALADALIRVLSDKDRAERLGRAGRLRARRLWSLDRFIDRYVRHYEELAANGSTTARRPQ